MRGLCKDIAMNGARLVISMACLLSAVSCSANEMTMKGDGQSNVVAGHGEQNFNENFDLSLEFPMAEDRFVTILKSKDIGFRIISPENGGVPVPRHSKNIDVSQFIRMYEIYGDVDIDRHVGKRFRAYVDSRGYVTYIENAFSYPGR